MHFGVKDSGKHWGQVLPSSVAGNLAVAALVAEAVDTALAAPLAKRHKQLDTRRRQKVEALVATQRLATAGGETGDVGTGAPQAEVTSKLGLVTA